MAPAKGNQGRTELLALSDEDLLTACLWAEARGEPERGQIAVAGVILNRVSRHMAKSTRGAILAPRQFSWTNPKDVNFSKVLEAPHADPGGWKRARRVARAAMGESFEDTSLGADHYLNVELTRKFRGGALPRWAEEGIRLGKVTAVIGNHTFLNLRG